MKKDPLQKKKDKDAEVSIMEYDHPILNIKEHSEEEKEEEKATEGLKGKALLKKVYQGGAISKEKPKPKPCWQGYEMVGMKEKGGRPVPNCVPMYRGGARTIVNTAQNDPIWQYSNPYIVQERASEIPAYAGLPIFRSTNREKKYQIIHPVTGKIIHFGQMGYQDYTQHLDNQRRMNYLRRATNIKGDWKKDPYSANNLAIHLLW